MRLAVSETVALPREAVWAEITDLDSLEALLSKRGIEIARDVPGAPIAEASWTSRFSLAGASRVAKVRTTEADAPGRLRIDGAGSGFESSLVLTLHAVDASTTRLDMEVAVAAKTLSAKVLIQPLKLAEAKIGAALEGYVARTARRLEDRHHEARRPEERGRGPGA